MRNRIRSINILVILLISVFLIIPKNVNADTIHYYDNDSLNIFSDEMIHDSIFSKVENNKWLVSYNFQIGDVNCTSLLGDVPEDGSDNGSVSWLLNKFFMYFKICVPIIVLIFSTVDFVKAIILNNDDNMKKAYNKLIIRIIIAIVLFLVPHLVQLLLTIFGMDANGICIVG